MTEPSPDNVTNSPLKEAKPLSLEDIFNKDPLDITDEEFGRQIEYLRNARKTFLADEAGKASKPKGVKAAAAGPKSALDKTLTADDLDLDL